MCEVLPQHSPPPPSVGQLLQTHALQPNAVQIHRIQILNLPGNPKLSKHTKMIFPTLNVLKRKGENCMLRG